MDAGFEEVLEFREDLIQIGSQLYLGTGTLLDQFHPESSQILELHESDVMQGNESEVIHRGNGFGDHQSIDPVSLGFADIVLPHGGRLDRVDQADAETFRDKEIHQVVAIVSSRFKTNDDAVLLERTEFGKQHVEAIIVIQEFERLDEYLAIGIDGRGKVIEFGDINANIDH
jgi:hypothetical protein